MTTAKRYILAFIYSGLAEPRTSVWPEKNRAWFSENMSKAWVEITTKLRCIEGTVPDEVALVPTCYEAKKAGSGSNFLARCVDMTQLYEAFGAWRSQAMKTVRLLIGAFFFSGLRGGANEIKQVCQKLLKEDRFCCIEVRRSDRSNPE